MRRLEDATGRVWDVVVGRESWGALYAIFVPKKEPGDEEGEAGPDVLQAALDSASYAEANREIEAMADAELLELLRRSTPKNAG